MAACLFSLPNEILLHVLIPLPTTDLLRLSSTSHRVYALVVRILHQRLLLASQLPEHTLLLECYHPSAKLTEPPLYCTYLGTEGLDKGAILSDKLAPGNHVPIGRLRDYNRLYSVFRPQRRAPEAGARRRRHPAGDVPGSRTHPSSSPSWMENTGSQEDVVKQTLSLDSHELFTQLCASLNLARSGPRRGLFFSFVEIDEGVLRVWRDWLKQMANGTTDSTPEDKGKNKTPISEGTARVNANKDESILWIDSTKRVGLKLNVHERRWRRDQPVLISADEVPVSYEVEFEGKSINTENDVA